MATWNVCLGSVDTSCVPLIGWVTDPEGNRIELWQLA
jgi:hypothetical protein